ncbi:hypothetical protein H0X32_01445 [Patescibacteria group bacterium]|nr:hypothetical protein [Patescibacteria group bacterium]
MKKVSYIVLSFLLLGLGLGLGTPALVSANAPLTPPTELSNCRTMPGWKAYTNPPFINIGDCERYVLGDRVGNDASASTLVDAGTNLFIEDTNHPATQAAALKKFVYYAVNTNSLFFVVVDRSGSILYSSPEVFPAHTGVNGYALPHLVGVPAGSQIAMFFPHEETVPYTINSTSTAPIIVENSAAPVAGQTVTTNAAPPTRAYSFYAEYIPTDDLASVAIANGLFSYGAGSVFSFYLFDDTSQNGAVIGSARNFTAAGKTSGPIECANFTGARGTQSAVFAYRNTQTTGFGAGLWTLAKAVTSSSTQTFQSSLVTASVARASCASGTVTGVAEPVTNGNLAVKPNRYGN